MGTRMKILRTIADLYAWRSAQKEAHRPIALVPTMGALHEGHLSLIRRAKQEADAILVSIFVNPIQFGPKEDLDKYPRDFEGDCKKAESAGASAVFAPTPEEMYPEGFQTHVSVGPLSECLCGKSRPTHFGGVCTVVLKLFLASGCDIALFGQKDYQQYQVITRMVNDLHVPVKLISCPIVREADGLALSSRNTYLTADARKAALSLPRALDAVADAWSKGERNLKVLLQPVGDAIAKAGGRLDYAEIRTAEGLKEFGEKADCDAVLAAAAVFDGVRLIDNRLLRF